LGGEKKGVELAEQQQQQQQQQLRAGPRSRTWNTRTQAGAVGWA
jgi:hypothetical protein